MTEPAGGVLTLTELRRAAPVNGWLAQALARVAVEPAAIDRLFPAAGRHCGRAALPAAPGWTVDEAARTLLLAALPPESVTARLPDLYRHGDPAEKRAALKALALLPAGGAGAGLLHDAIRSNDPRLLAAALGPAAAQLDAAAWRQAVLKCVYIGVPLAVVDRLAERADAELAAMLAAFRAERRAAGRDLPADAITVLDRLRED